MNSISFYKLRVTENFGESIKPEENENWESLYSRLNATIFNPDISPEERLFFAAQNGCEKALKTLLERFPKIKIDARKSGRAPTPLIEAAACGRVEAVRVLLENGADPHLKQGPFSLLFLAYVDGDSLDTIRVCLEHGTPVQKDFALAIIKKQDQDAVALLNTYNQTLDVCDSKDLKTPLFDIIEKYGPTDLDVLQWAIQSGCNVNHLDTEGRTPLHFAYGKKDLAAIQLLWERNAVAVKDTHGNDPFHWWLFEGNPESRWEVSKLEYANYVHSLKTRFILRAASFSITIFTSYFSLKQWIFPEKEEKNPQYVRK